MRPSPIHLFMLISVLMTSVCATVPLTDHSRLQLFPGE